MILNNRVLYDVNTDFRLGQSSGRDSKRAHLRTLRLISMISKGVLVVGSTDRLLGLVLRIVGRKSDVEMAAYSSLT